MASDRPNPKEAHDKEPADAVRHALSAASISLPTSLTDTVRLYDDIGRSIAAQFPGGQIQTAAAALDRQVAAALTALEGPRLAALEAATIARPDLSVIESLNRMHSQMAELHGSVTAGAKLAEAMRQLDVVSRFSDRIAAVVARPVDISSAIDASLANAVRALSLQVPSLPLPEEALAGKLLGDETPEVTLNAEVVEVGAKTDEGSLVVAVALPWFRIYEELERDPDFLFQFVKNPRRFEEFIAGAYELAGWNVTLTPRSGDGGRDVIAEKTGFGTLRFLEQCKAYKPGHRVTANDVRAMLGVALGDPRANKGLVTTTSQFAPGIENDPSLKPFLGYRLELKDGPTLLQWLKAIVDATR